MKKTITLLTVLLILVSLIACNNGGTSGVKIPSLSGYTAADLSGESYNIGSATLPTTNEATLTLFSNAFSALSGSMNKEGASPSYRNYSGFIGARADQTQTIDLGALFEQFGFLDGSGMSNFIWLLTITAPDSGKWADAKSELSYDYNSDEEVPCTLAPDWVKGKVKQLVQMHITNPNTANETIEMAVACSYAIACKIDGKGAKFILNIGLTGSITNDNLVVNHGSNGTLIVYNNAGVEQHRYTITDDDLAEFIFDSGYGDNN